MRTCYWLLVVLRFTAAYKIITKSMIHSPDESWYEPVPLKTRDEFTISTFQPEFDQEDPPNLDPVDEPPTVPPPSEWSEEEEYDEDLPTTTETNEILELPAESMNRTKLYPVGRLWERTRNDIWSILSEAFGCIWSGVGLDCFTYRVVPMFKSFMGYQPFNQPLFLMPRNGEIEGRRRNRRRHTEALKLAKVALFGLLGLKSLILPVLLGLALISGKALFASLLSTILTGATAWTAVKSADRRVQTDQPSQNYYM